MDPRGRQGEPHAQRGPRARNFRRCAKRRRSVWSAQGKVASHRCGRTSGKLVVDVRRVALRYGDSVVIADFSTRIMRGDRIGIIGPNGSEKDAAQADPGELEPDERRSRQARGYNGLFDQHRAYPRSGKNGA